MQTSLRIWLAGSLAALIAVSLSTPARSAFPKPQAPASPAVAVVNGGAGSCTADFVVNDSSGKGVYAAKIEIQIRYGFMGLHRLDATVSTNSEGKARIEGLPERINKTAEFKVSHGDQSKSLPYDPLADCHPRLQVLLGEK
jgi:hypothetical protein